jgi:hypothetical protein
MRGNNYLGPFPTAISTNMPVHPMDARSCLSCLPCLPCGCPYSHLTPCMQDHVSHVVSLVYVCVCARAQACVHMDSGAWLSSLWCHRPTKDWVTHIAWVFVVCLIDTTNQGSTQDIMSPCNKPSLVYSSSLSVVSVGPDPAIPSPGCSVDTTCNNLVGPRVFPSWVTVGLWVLIGADRYELCSSRTPVARASHIMMGAPYVVTYNDLIATQERKGSRRLVPAKAAGVAVYLWGGTPVVMPPQI